MIRYNYKINRVISRCSGMVVLCFFSLLYAGQVLAAFGDQATGAGGLANEMMEPVGMFSHFVNAACIILGTSFVFASVVKYFEHRRSPLMVPISTVVFLFIGGTVLLMIPLFSYFFASNYHLGL